MTDGHSRNDGSRLRDEHSDAVQPLARPEPEHQFEHLLIGGNALPLLDRAHQTRRGHDFEALVDADKEFGRNDRTLNRPELHALDLPRDRPQLARRVDFGPDAAARSLLDRGRIVLSDLMRCIVYGGGGDLHHIGLLLRRLREAKRPRRPHEERGNGHRRADSTRETHVALLVLSPIARRQPHGVVALDTDASAISFEGVHPRHLNNPALPELGAIRLSGFDRSKLSKFFSLASLSLPALGTRVAPGG